MKCLIVCAMLFCSAALIPGQSQTTTKSDQPHKVVLSPEVRTKIELAYWAVIDVEDLGSSQEYVLERIDARRALREARVAALGQDAMALIGDIDLILIHKATCRSANTVSESNECFSKEEDLIHRVEIKLGRPARK